MRAGIRLNSDEDWLSLVKASHAPPGAESHQTWAKHLPGGAMAVLFVNGGPENSTAAFSSSLASLIDVWSLEGTVLMMRQKL